MNDLYFFIVCKLHYFAKRFLGKTKKPLFRFVNLTPTDFSKDKIITIEGSFINELTIDTNIQIKKNEVFPIENCVSIEGNKQLQDSFVNDTSSTLTFTKKEDDVTKLWIDFIICSKIQKGYKFEGLHYTGYIASNVNSWCLPSWIWTNAALVRFYCSINKIKEAEKIANILEQNQHSSGGWIVRNDYNAHGAIPVLAPNDSSYIANNAFLELYKKTKNQNYLSIAKKCADWVIETAREDGLVWTGYDTKNSRWITNHTIVDTGFTAGLIANLYAETEDDKYKVFLEKFTSQFVNLFYNPSQKGFATSINKENKKTGGVFARGQAWALEGLIPTYKVLKDPAIEKIIDETVFSLIEKQSSNGGWSYNFPKPYLGQDCKGISVIAKSLLDWYEVKPNNNILKSCKKALNWCIKHTAKNDEAKGGIFSFCMEGAVVHTFYTSTAFVYSSAYAIELHNAIKKVKC